jgi:hypothetical protein
MMAEQIATLATAMILLVRAHVERVAAELPTARVAGSASVDSGTR